LRFISVCISYREDQINYLSNRAIWSLLLAAVLGGLPLPARAQAFGCHVSLDQVRLAQPLKRLADRLATGQPITIVGVS